MIGAPQVALRLASQRQSTGPGDVSPHPRPDGLTLFDTAVVAAEYRVAGDEFHRLLHTLTAEELRSLSAGTRRTNEQLLFHMLFGYMVVQRLVPLVCVVSRLPEPVGRGFARVWGSGTPPFDVVNYWGSRWGVSVFNHERMGRKRDRVTDSLLRRLERETDADLAREEHRFEKSR